MFLKNLVKNSLQIIFSLTLMLILGLSIISLNSYAQANQPLVPTRSDICRGNECPLGINDTTNISSATGLVEFIINISRFITFVAVGIAVLFMVYGGVTYITAGTSDGNEKGKQILVNATIGLIIAIIAYTIVSVVSSLVSGQLFAGFLE